MRKSVLQDNHRNLSVVSGSVLTELYSRNEAYMTLTERSMLELVIVPDRLADLDRRMLELQRDISTLTTSQQYLPDRHAMINACVSHALRSHKHFSVNYNSDPDEKMPVPEVSKALVSDQESLDTSANASVRSPKGSNCNFIHRSSFQSMLFNIEVRTMHN